MKTRWTKVEDNTPRTKGWYLVWIEDSQGGDRWGKAYYSSDGIWITSGGNKTETLGDKVTHWAPAPSAPY